MSQLLLNSTVKDTRDFKCQPQGLVGLSLLFPIAGLGFVINTVVSVAASLYRKGMLRQNHVYYCVQSTLLGNVITLFINVFRTSSVVIAIQNNQLAIEASKKTFGLVLQALEASMLMVITFNLGALIFVMLDTTYFHSAARQLKPKKQTKSTTHTLAQKKLKTLLIVTFSWLFPPIISMFGLFFLNCSDSCRCSYGAKGIFCDQPGCSIIWEPVLLSFLGMQIGVWIFQIILLLAVIIRGFKEFLNFAAPKTPEVPAQYNFDQSKKNLPLPGEGKKENTLRLSDKKRTFQSMTSKKLSRVPSWSSWNPRLKLAVILPVIYIICTLPLGVGVTLDIARVQVNPEIARYAAVMGTQIYMTVSPILMVKYMPNLRATVVRLFSALISIK